MAVARYFVSDVDRSVSFYGALGFELAERYGPPFAIMSRDGLDLWLSGPGTSGARPMPDGRIPEPGGWNRIVVQVDDLDIRTQALRAAGVTFRSDPISGPGGSQVLVEDPDGNPIELFQPRAQD